MEEGYFIIKSGMKEGFVYDFLAGIDYFDFGGMHLGKWLAGMVLILFGMGLWLLEKRRIMPFEMVRFDSGKHWWNTQFWNLFLLGMSGGLFYEFCMLGLDCLFGKEKPKGMEEILILLLWLVHMMVIISIFCLFHFISMGRIAAAAVLVMEVSGFILGFYLRDLSKYMFGCWGMYMRSKEADEIYGFSPAVVLILECVTILAVWRAGAKAVEKKECAKWSI